VFRKKVKKGEMPSWMHDALTEVQGRFPEGQSIRCRSSTNNEDLPGFSGAGLYDSFTHKPDEGHLSVSVRQVFASLWNFRAYEEREFHRIDHLMAAMGVVLHPNQKREQVNGVAVTKDVLYKAQHPSTRLYFVNVQVGEDLVTNPEAASVPEELLLSPRNPRRDRVLQRSNRGSDGASLLSSKHRQELRRCMRTLHDRFARLYGRGDDDAFAIEIEFKVTEAGDLLIKQARPWID
ncbi:MAG: PEP/pyruvate-binding domain-containing protein, partial [Planctomycetota bacterium]|nr:PEP/pyruvate-binding domain-containing protein [Planctomycetota bacterium]